MAESPCFKDLLQALNEFKVEYLIVGGHAVMKYTEPRFTKDLDVWVANSAENATRVCDALAKFGAPLSNDGVTPETFREERIVYQLGVAPVRIDVLTHIVGVQFAEAWKRRVEGIFMGIPANFISPEDLMVNKQCAGRELDLEDFRQIQKRVKAKS